MEIKRITDLIENFAPLELQDGWDNCGVQIDFGERDIKKVLLCVSITQDIVNQAVEKDCDIIISHHPLFFIPFEFNKNIPIYSAHTNLDKADGGTTDTIIEILGFSNVQKGIQKVGDFTRLIELNKEILLEDFVKLLKDKLNIENVRVVNNLKSQLKPSQLNDGGQVCPPYSTDLSQASITTPQNPKLSKIAFCAGSGADLLWEAQNAQADAFVTGDVKYHQALESNVIIIDVGHFESERPILKKIQKILAPLNLEVMEADEKSPFINY